MEIFQNSNDFKSWLSTHVNDDGIWIKFDKTRQHIQLTSDEALKTALCFGWIDGVIKRIDDIYYMKYFAKRRPHSIWSTRNKALVEQLIRDHLMMDEGYMAIEIAKQNGSWQKADSEPDDFSLDVFESLIHHDLKAYSNYQHMSRSIQKTYALHYFTAKKIETRNRRLEQIINRLSLNLKPMDEIK